ncbi:hypothetical protein DL98DRAFT_584059 [Cadophora sp. DSE1049]|nr:hypothetical protein DL98DRAFT_584059 [Cadophora sp. DSE1049]
MSGLDAASLAIYGVLAIPLLYILARHGWPGFLGWLFLFAFCSLRIIGGAMALINGSKSSSTAIISNMGLSPLLLAMVGILHEARYYRTPKFSNKIEWLLVIVIHLIITSGLALVASGASSFGAKEEKNKHDEIFVKIGIMVLVVGWVLVCVWTLISFLPSQYNRDAPIFINGSKLLCAVLFSLPFVCVRLIYSVVSIFSPSKDLNPVSGSLGLRIGLSFLMELITVIGFTLVGLATHGIRRQVQPSKHTRMRSLRATQGEVETVKRGVESSVE